jgi:hypothetical protein
MYPYSTKICVVCNLFIVISGEYLKDCQDNREIPSFSEIAYLLDSFVT